MHSREDFLPELKLAQFDSNPLNWHKLFGQFKSTVNLAVLKDDTYLTYLQLRVTGKAKTAIAELTYSGVRYKDALATLHQEFGQPHTFIGAHLDKLKYLKTLVTSKAKTAIAEFS